MRKKDERKEQKLKANALNYGFNLSNSTFGSDGEFSLPFPPLIKGSCITQNSTSWPVILKWILCFHLRRHVHNPKIKASEGRMRGKKDRARLTADARSADDDVD